MSELKDEGRRHERVPVQCKGSARVAVGIDILDASQHGVRARMSVALPVGTLIKIGMPGGGERHARIAWSEDGIHGCEFIAPISESELRALTRYVPLSAAA